MLTIFISTRNGGRTLPRLLDAYTRLEQPPGGWKLVIVDNGSTDATREIIESFQQRLPLTYLFEGRMGKNVALNTALAHLDGDLAVFSDDDTFPRPDWLLLLCNAADRLPEYSMFGGKVIGHWETEPPPWLEWVNQPAVFALSSPALKEGPVAPCNVFGPNMAVRAEFFYSGTRFEESIGPCGSNYAMGSESELLWRLGEQGCKAWHVENAVVEHFIRCYQLDKSWVLKRGIRLGRGQLRMRITEEPEAISPLLGIPPIVLFKILVRALRVVRHSLAPASRQSFTARWEYNLYRGYLIEACQLKKRALQEWLRSRHHDRCSSGAEADGQKSA